MAKESPWTPFRPTHGSEDAVAEGRAEERAEERARMLGEEMWKRICHGMSKGMEEEMWEGRGGKEVAQCSTHPRPALQHALPGPSPVAALP